MSTILLAGSARVDITPPLSIPHLAYVPRQGKFKNVHDPLFARALVLENEDMKIAVISADSIGYSNDILGADRNFTSEVRRMVEHRVGIDAQNIMLASTHAHSTPETTGITRLLDVPEAAPWLEVLIDQLASAVEIAVSNLTEVHLKAGIGEAEGIGYSRRIIGKDGKIYHWTNRPTDDQIARCAVDNQVGVLLCESVEDNLCSVLINFACHPVTVQVQPSVSADYPGVATNLVEQTVSGCRTHPFPSKGGNCLFLQGAGGNINPLLGTTNFDDVERYGMILAGAVMQVVGKLRSPETPMMEPILGMASEVVYLPARELPEREPFGKAYEEALLAIKNAKTEEEKYAASRTAIHNKETLDLIDRGTDPIRTEVQVMRIGDVALVATPGELFAELGLEIKQKSVAPYTFVIGYTNDWIGYIISPGTFAEGGYEASPGPWTRAGEEGGQIIVKKALELIKKLW
jgi:hypothetical protein